MKDGGDKRYPETYAIIGAAMEVHKVLGNGFLEAVYKEAFERELALREIPFAREMEFGIDYKGQRLAPYYKADFVCYGTTIVEIKALRKMGGGEESQVLNYLKASGLPKALLLNFGTRTLEYKRYIRKS